MAGTPPRRSLNPRSGKARGGGPAAGGLGIVPRTRIGNQTVPEKDFGNTDTIGTGGAISGRGRRARGGGGGGGGRGGRGGSGVTSRASRAARLAKTLAVEEEAYVNPFREPDPQEIFRMRDEDRQRRRREREELRTKKIWEKSTAASRQSRTVLLRETQLPADIPETEEEKRIRESEEQTRAFVEQAKASTRRRHGLEKESLTDFIKSKRQMFLLQYSLNVKRNEMQKLDEEAIQRELTVHNQAALLAAEAFKFNAFLKDSSESAKEAKERAEKALSEKTQAMVERQSLEQEIMDVEKQIAAANRKIEQYTTYKEFVDEFASKQWKDAQKAKKRQRRDEMRAARREERRQERAHRRAQVAQERARAREARRAARSGSGGSSSGSSSDRVGNGTRSSSYSVSSSTDSDDSDYDEMYFQDPDELLAEFQLLEKDNLNLIQKSQKVNETLEKIQLKFQAVYEFNTGEITKLESQIADLDAQILRERERIRATQQREVAFQESVMKNKTTVDANQGAAARNRRDRRVRLDGRGGGGSRSEAAEAAAEAAARPEDLLAAIQAKVLEVHNACIPQNTAVRSTLERLRKLENGLEAIRSYLLSLDKKNVADEYSKLESADNARKTQERLRVLLEDQEQRKAEQLARAQRPIQKKRGKPLMRRSNLFQRKEKQTQNTDEDDLAAAEEAYFFGR